MEVSLTGDEYILENHFYHFKWHTFATESDMSRERVLKREIVRLPRQAKMLLHDMAAGERILVRLADHGSSEDGLDQFVRLCGKLGPSQVLFVSRDAAKAGTVERVGPTLIRGYIEQFADAANVAGTTKAEPWIELCRNTVKLIDDV